MITIDPCSVCGRCSLCPHSDHRAAFSAGKFFAGRATPRRNSALLSAYVLENLSGIRVVQHTRKSKTRFTASTSSAPITGQKYVADDALGIFWPLMQVMAGLAATVVLWLGGRQILQAQ